MFNPEKQVAALNKVMLIGRLTRDPEVRTFQNGGKVAKFGLAVNEKKKNAQSGQWEDSPVFIDCECFNSDKGRKLADLVEQYLKKGSQIFLEGKLKLDQWTDKDGQKKSKLGVLGFEVQFLDGKQQEGAAPARNGPVNVGARTAPGEIPSTPASTYGNDDDIPF